MSNEMRPAIAATDLAFGICLVALGVALTLDRLHVIPASEILRFWPLGIVLFGVSLVIQAVQRANGRAPSRRVVAPGPVIGFLILGFVVTNALQRDTSAKRVESEETATLFAVMGSDQRISYAKNFRGGEMTAVMGGSELDLRQATIPPGEVAVINVFGLMGGLLVRVPNGWIVDVQTVPLVGGVSDQRGGANDPSRRRRRRADNIEAERTPPQPEAAPETPTPETPTPESSASLQGGVAPRLVVRGFIMMGGLVIKS